MKFDKLKTIYKNRVLQHTLFWFVSFIILVRLFANSSEPEKIDYIYTALFHLSILLGVYLNLIWLIPKLLSKNKFIAYIFWLLVIIAGSAEANILFFSKLVDHLLPGYYFISYYEFTDILKFIIVYILITSLLKLAKGWFALADSNRQISQLQKEKTETELIALKNQINPHFLFNSLNSIYSLALSQSKKTPEMVVKLSDIMRYIIYEAKDDLVDLKKEVKYLTDYIALQKLRSDDRAIIKVDISGNLENKQIAPLLLFPLIENSFKHGIKGETGKSFITFRLSVDDHGIQCVIENNKGKSDEVVMDEYKGIGLNNVRRRLQMIYPNNHQLNIIEKHKVFRVELIINNITSNQTNEN